MPDPKPDRYTSVFYPPSTSPRPRPAHGTLTVARQPQPKLQPSMGACLCRLLCCRRAKPANEYKKLDARSAGPIDLEGGQMGDDEDWDDFTPEEAGPSQPQPAAEEEPEPEPDPVAEAFADMGMAPVITKTKRHVTQHGQSGPLAVPELGSCASSGRAWRLCAARHSREEADPLGA